MNPEDLTDLIASIITAAVDPANEGRLALLATLQRHKDTAKANEAEAKDRGAAQESLAWRNVAYRLDDAMFHADPAKRFVASPRVKAVSAWVRYGGVDSLTRQEVEELVAVLRADLKANPRWTWGHCDDEWFQYRDRLMKIILRCEKRLSTASLLDRDF
jgi:hypothetical protein